MGRNKYRRRRRLLGFLAFLLGIFIIIIVADNHLRPIIKNMAQVQAQAISTKTINEAITKVLADENITYDQLVEIKQDSNGRVIAMNTNIVELNRLKAEINIQILEALSQLQNSEIEIPIGSLLGNDFLIGRGPSIKIHLKMTNNIVSNIDYAFESAGINQTLHQINLVVSTNIYAVIPWYNTLTQVETNFCLAETVIVGEVPDAFTQITEAEGSDTAEDYADYGAESAE